MGPRGRAAHAAGALVGCGQDAAPFADHSGDQAGFRQLNTKPTAPAIPCRRRNSSGDKAGIRSAGSGTPAPSRTVATTTAAEAVGERRNVRVMFCGLVGSTG